MPLENICQDWKMGTADEVDTKDKRGFIQMNGFPSGYKCTRSFLKAAL